VRLTKNYDSGSSERKLVPNNPITDLPQGFSNSIITAKLLACPLKGQLSLAILPSTL
jgi:hypothetical protein